MHVRLQLWCIMRFLSPCNFVLQYGHITVGCGGHITFGAGARTGRMLWEGASAREESASTRLVSATHALETWSFMFEAFLDASIRLIHSAFLDSVISSMVKYLRQLGPKQPRRFKDFRVLPRDRWQGSARISVSIHLHMCYLSNSQRKHIRHGFRCCFKLSRELV